VVFQCTATLTYCHPRYTTTNWGPVVYNITHVMTQRWNMVEWTENELYENTSYACFEHKKQTEGLSIYLYIAITIYNIYCCNFYLLLSHYFNPAVLTHKVSVTKCQSTASFGIFVFKLPYIYNSTNQCHSLRLNIWRDRATGLKKGILSKTQQKHIAFKIKTAYTLCI